MARKHSLPSTPPLKEPTAPLPSPDDLAYRTLLLEESEAYSAWFFYSPAQPSETKEHLSELRRFYEQKRRERLAYQPPQSSSPDAP